MVPEDGLDVVVVWGDTGTQPEEELEVVVVLGDTGTLPGTLLNNSLKLC